MQHYNKTVCTVVPKKKNVYLILYTYIILLLSYRNDYTCTDKCNNIIYIIMKCIIQIIWNIINLKLVLYIILYPIIIARSGRAARSVLGTIPT